MENLKLQGTAPYSNQRMCNCLKPFLRVASSLLFFLHVAKCVALRTQLTFKCCVLYHWSVVCLFVCLDCLLQFFLEVASSFDRLRRVPVSYYVQRCSVLCWFSISIILMTWLVFLAGLTWHLRKTNWIGEPTDALDNEVNTTMSFHKKIKSSSITFHLSYRTPHWRMKALKMATLLLLKRDDLPQR